MNKPSVLYSFTILDYFSSTQEEIEEHVRSVLSREALEQGWAEGYRWEQSREPELLPEGGLRYFFTVEGERDE